MPSEALTIRCPSCYADPGRPCYDIPGIHKVRRAAVHKAKARANACHCRNHLGGPKSQHRTREAAVLWMLNAAHHGMRMEPYRCPTTDRWHVRTARKVKS